MLFCQRTIENDSEHLPLDLITLKEILVIVDKALLLKNCYTICSYTS